MPAYYMKDIKNPQWSETQKQEALAIIKKLLKINNAPYPSIEWSIRVIRDSYLLELELNDLDFKERKKLQSRCPLEQTEV